jgi:hypothetical protein
MSFTNEQLKELGTYQIGELSDEQLKELAISQLEFIKDIVKSERDELANEYHTGDALCYPPDWYDSYVYPLDRTISRIEDIITDDEDSDEDSFWN